MSDGIVEVVGVVSSFHMGACTIKYKILSFLFFFITLSTTIIHNKIFGQRCECGSHCAVFDRRIRSARGNAVSGSKDSIALFFFVRTNNCIYVHFLNNDYV